MKGIIRRFRRSFSAFTSSWHRNDADTIGVSIVSTYLGRSVLLSCTAFALASGAAALSAFVVGMILLDTIVTVKTLSTLTTTWN